MTSLTPSIFCSVAAALVLTLSGCAKTPQLTAAAAPAPAAPTPAAPPPAAEPAPRPAAAEPAPAPTAVAPPAPVATAAPAPRPAPSAFELNDALRPIYFDFDKSEIRPDDARTLEVNARWLVEHRDQALLVEGHCDPRGTNEYNLALGERRARAALDFLVSRGVASSRIQIVSYGEERPVCREENEACWSRDRRAMFLTKPQ